MSLPLIGQASGVEVVWVVIGWCGQAMFFLRFLIQWIVSERRRQSVIPTAFWYLSIAGAIGLLAYSLWRRDPVFIVGQLMGLAVYVRNLQWHSCQHRSQAT